MKIVQMIYSLSPGGAERFVVDLSNQLANEGHQVFLIVLLDDNEGNHGFYRFDLSPKITYVNLNLKKGFRLSNIYILAKQIFKIKPEIVHTHQNLVNYIFPVTLFYRKVKFFYTVHNDAPKEVSSSTEFLLRKFFFSKKLIKVITISKETSSSYKDYFGSVDFTEIYNGRKKEEPSLDFEIVKEEIGKLKTNEVIFLHIGRCAEQKNQKMLISVFNRLIAEKKEVILLIIGGGFNSELGQELINMAERGIYFLGTKNNVVDYYLNADAFCLSSNYEGMPITLIEAFSYGCTPICTPVGGITSLVIDEETGFLSDSLSENDYYKAINRYLNKRNEIKKVELEKIYKTRLSIEKCTNEHIKLYKN